MEVLTRQRHSEQRVAVRVVICIREAAARNQGVVEVESLDSEELKEEEDDIWEGTRESEQRQRDSRRKWLRDEPGGVVSNPHK